MIRKKLLARIMSVVLTAAVVCSSLAGAPATVYAAEEDEISSGSTQSEGLTDFTGDDVTVDQENHTVTLSKYDGENKTDHFAVYNGLEQKAKDFVFEADVQLKGDGISAALILTQNKSNPAESWIGANFNTDDLDKKGQFRIFGVNSNIQENSLPFWDGLNKTALIHLELDVTADGKYIYRFGNKGDQELHSLQGTISDWDGAYAGILTFKSEAEFSNITFTENPDRDNTGGDDNQTGLIDFTPVNAAQCEIDTANHTITLKNSGGDNFAKYNGLVEKANDFVLEADVDLIDGEKSAGLVFNRGSSSINADWGAANVHPGNAGSEFRVFGTGNEEAKDGKGLEGIDVAKTLHLKLDVKADGSLTYTFGNKDGQTRTIQTMISSWQGGYVGLLSFNSTVKFSNISFENRTADAGYTPITPEEPYHTNLTNLSAMANGKWNVTEEGLYSNAVDKGDSFLYSSAQGTDFVYSTDVTFKQNKGAASLVLRNADSNKSQNCYILNIDAGSKECKFWKLQNGSIYDMSQVDKTKIEPKEGNQYTLKAVAVGSWISCYVNDILVASTGDYLLQGTEKGQSTSIDQGYFGLLNWNGEMVFQNTYYKEITDANSPLITDVTVTSTGDVEPKGQFFPEEPTHFQYAKNNAKTVNLTVTKKNENASIKVLGTDGTTEYPNGQNIPLEVGPNFLTVISSSSVDEAGTTAVLTYRVNVHRRQADEVYYNEPYRGQYHYSVKDGWGNDPNGMIYYNGKYHFFYQFYEGTSHGPMHWAHSVSTDMIHWEEEPIAFYPDESGVMFNGYIVQDEENTSGLFKETDTCRWVALITINGNGQRFKAAYSTDEGKTWTKVKEIAADWEDDPLGSRDFRDPQIFRYENKWFLTVAGGPLRIYSSDNLLEWNCESAYGSFHTECPDLFPLQAEDGTVKWLLNGGGRFYKIGDFKEVNGRWTFVPDDDYGTMDNTADSEVMNFGKDSYATMRYYDDHDFGTAANPVSKDIIVANWMNTWEYCTAVGKAVGQDFNGTYNLTLKLGLTKNKNGKYILTQTPIEQYETLRDTEHKTELKNVDITEHNDLLKDFAGDSYEIVSNFKPAAGTKKVGFKLRTDGSEETVVVYDLETKKIAIDRSKSGIMVSGGFGDPVSQTVEPNDDGSVDLHIYVDRASVEVFTKGYTAAGAEQIFPSITSLGASVFAEGEAAKADIMIYPMQSIWKDKLSITEDTMPTAIQSSSPETSNINVGSELQLSVNLLPVGVKQDVTWSVSDDTVVSIAQGSDKSICRLKGLKNGTAKITAVSVKNPDLKKEFTVNVYENNFDTNITSFIANGNWFINDKTLSVANTAANDSYMTAEKIPYEEYTLETSIKYTKGLINIFFASETVNPSGAYAIQLGDSQNIRLFFMAGDTIKEAGMGKNVNDGQYHTVKIDKTKTDVTVSVDGAECLKHTFEEPKAYYTDAYAGIGLWDGALEVQKFTVAKLGEAIQYTVTFDADNGSNPVSVTVDADGKAVKPADPTKEGYIFKGWYAADSGEAFDFNTVISADITLTAKWEAEQTKTFHTVTFDPANGSSKTTVTVTAGGKVTKPADPVRSGYTFKGWYAAGSTAAFDFNITITADITLTAVWEKTAGQDTNPAAIQISASKITVAKAVYSGKALKPKVTVTYNGVTLKEKTDYTLKYSNNKKVGQGSVAVTGKGNYTGSKTVKFNILPKANKISKLTNKKGKKLVVKFSKSTGAKGYEVSYSTNKKFKSAKKKTTKKSSITLIKLKKGKTYYVRVRPYAKIGKKNVYGAYSKAVRIKIVK